MKNKTFYNFVITFRHDFIYEEIDLEFHIKEFSLNVYYHSSTFPKSFDPFINKHFVETNPDFKNRSLSLKPLINYGIYMKEIHNKKEHKLSCSLNFHFSFFFNEKIQL